MSAPDVLVAWLQHDFGQLGRPAEAVARVLAESELARNVAYVEPFHAGGGEAALDHRLEGALHVFTARGAPPAGAHEVADAVCGLAGLEAPILLNFGVEEANWWMHYEYAPRCSRSVLVTYDKLHEWDRLAARRSRLERVRALLIASSDRVRGMSTGSIDDVPGAEYVGHGCDATWEDRAVDATPEPEDLRAIPRPRAVYVGAMSMRFEAEAVRALARAGVEVVLIGLMPAPDVLAAAAQEPRVHLLGERHPDQTPGYLLHADVGIIPHTDEPFTLSMEPHKAYNYACAGLPVVALHAAHPPALDELVVATGSVPEFTAAVLAAIQRGRLDGEQVARARSLTWRRVAERLIA